MGERQMCMVSIVIATFRRPYLLEKAIESCVNQSNSLKLNVQIVVVDNSPERSAQAVVQRLATENAMPITYINVPEQNISLARNAGILHSDAQFIAFIDDDERATPQWLDHLVATQRICNADLVYGPVIPIFEGGTPPRWDPDAFFLFVREKFRRELASTAAPRLTFSSRPRPA
jgi:succinoglycan biosynthesis protein ExoM